LIPREQFKAIERQQSMSSDNASVFQTLVIEGMIRPLDNWHRKVNPNNATNDAHDQLAAFGDYC